MILRLLKRCLIFITLILFRKKGNCQFMRHVTKNCKKRQRLINLPGVPEELDEVSDSPENCDIETRFTCFNRDGLVFTARTSSSCNNEGVEMVTLDIPGIGQYQSYQDPASHRRSELDLDMVQPMSQWRIKFRGLVTANRDTVKTEPVYVTVMLYWRSNSDPFNHWSNVPSWTLATHFDNVSIAKVFDQISNNDYVFYEQWGDVNGRITIEGQSDIEVFGWKCSRARLIETQSANRFDGFVSNHVFIDDDGTKFITGAMLNKTKLQRNVGLLAFPIGERWALDLSDVSLSQGHQIYPDLANQYVVKTCGMAFNVSTEKQKIGIEFKVNGEASQTRFTQFSVNGKQAYGIVYNRSGRLCIPEKKTTPTKYKTCMVEELIVNLREGPYSNTNVGGKASTLSILQHKGYNVPMSLCITVSAFNDHLRRNEDLRKAVDTINASVREAQIKDLPSICKEAIDICKETSLESHLKIALEEKMREAFKDNRDNISFAVRSSGVNEDGQSASFAGQLETYLGIKELPDIVHAVTQCWASNLSYRTVEYRRQLGLPLVDGMGVIIQTMVASDVAGVLFTNDPLTGNPANMIINASYGLGESVVSGEVTPDTIVVKRNDGDKAIVIHETLVGSKDCALKLNEDGQTEKHTETSAEKTDMICLSEKAIVDLSRIGIDIEMSLEHAQDIEWAFVGSDIYILQARPITSIDIERDEDMYREFDSGYMGDNDCYTLANVGEVLPGACTPLMLTSTMTTFDVGFNYATEAASTTALPKYASIISVTFYNRLFINLTVVSLRSNILPGEDKSANEIFLVGEPVPGHKKSAVLALQGRRPNFLARMTATFRHYFIEMRTQPKRFSKLVSTLDTFTIGENCNTAAVLHDAISSSLPFMSEVWKGYNYSSTASVTWTGIIMMMLKGKQESLSQENFADISILLSECKNTESADVPAALDSLAKAIAVSDVNDVFLNTPDGDCHLLLREKAGPAVKDLYTSFLKRHGHRSFRELELFSKSWAMDPSLLMRQLKSLIRSQGFDSAAKGGLSVHEAVDRLQTPLSGFQKYLLKRFLVDRARKGVAARESGKSASVKTLYVIKKAYWRLADMMVREGFLPEEKLAFFLTHRELGILIEQPSASLVQRAKRRMKIRPILENMRFPLLNFSRPIPVTEQDNNVSVKLMKGLPVGRGVAIGRACVISTLAEADSIEKDDILICPFTDVGWTPYFPLLSGVVTELGGMVSHGAVVAREYGLPCVANVQNATLAFKTGDRVKVDGGAGTLELLEG